MYEVMDSPTHGAWAFMLLVLILADESYSATGSERRREHEQSSKLTMSDSSSTSCLRSDFLLQLGERHKLGNGVVRLQLLPWTSGNRGHDTGLLSPIHTKTEAHVDTSSTLRMTLVRSRAEPFCFVIDFS